MKNKTISPRNYSSLLDRIADILVEARIKVVREINKAQVLAYWEIGREIVEFEQKGKIRAEYGQRLLIKLSEDLVQKFGRGFSVDNLQLMRRFYITFPGNKFTRHCLVNLKNLKQCLTNLSKGNNSKQHLENLRQCLVNSQFGRRCLPNFKKARQCLVNSNRCSPGHIIVNY